MVPREARENEQLPIRAPGPDAPATGFLCRGVRDRGRRATSSAGSAGAECHSDRPADEPRGACLVLSLLLSLRSAPVRLRSLPRSVVVMSRPDQVPIAIDRYGIGMATAVG
jgi:hypothetical protein